MMGLVGFIVIIGDGNTQSGADGTVDSMGSDASGTSSMGSSEEVVDFSSCLENTISTE